MTKPHQRSVGCAARRAIRRENPVFAAKSRNFLRRALSFIMLLALCAVADNSFAATAQQEAAALSVVAGGKAKSGDYKLCAAMYQQCYRMDPSFLGYLYSAARCAQKGGQLDLAERHYREFLLRSPAEHPLRKRADGHMKELMVARRAEAVLRDAAAKAKAEAAAAARVAEAKGGSATGTHGGVSRGPGDDGAHSTTTATTSRPMTSRAMRGWASVGGGALLAGLSSWLLWQASADAAALRSDLALPTGTRLIDKLTYAQAKRRAKAVRSSQLLAGVAGGGALLALGAGAWWLLTDKKPSKSTFRLSPLPGNLQAVWELRW